MATAHPQTSTVEQLPAPPSRAPGVRRYLTPFGFFLEARRDPLAWVEQAARELGDVIRVEAWPFVMHMFFHPDHVRHVLQENNRNYWKGNLVAKAKPLIGEGLFTSEGDFWRRQRRLAQPAFHRQRIESFAGIMTDATSRMLDRWRARQGETIDVMREMSSLTLAIVGRALFGMDLTGDAAEVGRSMLIALEFLNHQATHFVPVPLAIPTPRNVRFRRARRELDRVVFGIIDERRRNGLDGGDLLAMLMATRDAESGEQMSDRQLRDEVMTFVLAGHETTAVTLAWAFHLLSHDRHVTERVRHEVDTVLAGRKPTLADLPRLALTRRVIEETLRLYPPVPMVSRQSFAADEIDGHRIPADSPVILSPYATHRHPDFWEEPERFDPDRFTEERSLGRPRFAYFPFSGGPRLCIGNEFALMEAQIILAMIMQRHRLEALPGHTVETEVRVTLRPRGCLPMRLADS